MLPVLHDEAPPPRGLLSGARLLANALRLRTGKGALEARREEEARRVAEEAAGTRAAKEAARRALLDAALPVLLRICREAGSAEAEALASSLDALRKHATHPVALSALARHGALRDALDLLGRWPDGLGAVAALDACELVRALLLHPGRRAAEPAPVEGEAVEAEAAAEGGEDEEEEKEEERGCAAHCAPVAAVAGEALPSLLGWVAATSEAHPPPDELTAEESLQRGLCSLLCALLSGAPADASLGHAELEALRPLLAHLRSQRRDPDLCTAACEALASLAARSAHLCKQAAKLGAVKGVLLTCRAHLKHAPLHEAAVAWLRAAAEASGGCRRLLLEAHGVPTLCAIMRRHGLVPRIQRDGAAALAALCLPGGGGGGAEDGGGGEGLRGRGGEGRRRGARRGDAHLRARAARPHRRRRRAAGAAAAQPGLIQRNTMANGKRWLEAERPSAAAEP